MSVSVSNISADIQKVEFFKSSCTNVRKKVQYLIPLSFFILVWPVYGQNDNKHEQSV